MSEAKDPPSMENPHKDKLSQLGAGWRRVQSGDMVIYETAVPPEYFIEIADRRRTYNQRSILWRILRKLGVIRTELV